MQYRGQVPGARISERKLRFYYMPALLVLILQATTQLVNSGNDLRDHLDMACAVVRNRGKRLEMEFQGTVDQRAHQAGTLMYLLVRRFRVLAFLCLNIANCRNK
jgi:hypothetical protein